MKIEKRVLVLVLALVAWVGVSVSWAQPSLNWRDDLLFERTSIDENVEDILRAVLSLNGVDTIFKPGVEGKVTFQFRNMPLQAAFNKLIQENDLDFDYDPSLNVMTIFPKKEVVSSLELYSPKNVSLNVIKKAMDRFDVHGGRIIYDDSTETMVVRGATDEVADILKVAKHVDESYLSRLEASEHKAQLERQKRLKELESDALEKALVNSRVETAVIPLQYVTVGATKTQFQGEEVTIPGIEETLKALLGVDTNPNAQGSSTITIPAQNLGNSVTQALGLNEESTQNAQAASTSPTIKLPDVTVQLSTDPRTNSVIVRGPGYVIDDIRNILKDLDRPVPLVDIEVVIVEGEAGLSRALGVQWASATNGNTGNNLAAGVATGPAGNTTSTAGQSVLNLAGTANVDPVTLLPLATTDSLVASFIYNGTSSFISAQINALASDQRAEVISSPHVVTLNNVAAKITSATNVTLLTNAGVGAAGTTTTISAGLTLDITPSVFRDDVEGADALIRMSVSAKNSSFTATQTTSDKEVQTQVVLRDSATFVMGGLFENNRNESETGVPGLRDIPILGGLFKNRTATTNRKETIFFITPRVIDETDLVSADIGVGQDMRENRAAMGREIRSYMRDQSRRLGGETGQLHRQSPLDAVESLEEDE